MENNIKYLLWDFDGVLMDSNDIRSQGFADVLKDYSVEDVNKLLEFHRENGGLSRYVKFRYFFEVIRKEEVTDEQVEHLAQRFSKIMLSLLMDSNLLIAETLDFVKANFEKIPMHIVSGSDGVELRLLCNSHDLSQFFRSIEGSPTPKKQLVSDLLNRCGYERANCALIGDSINDFDAANVNGIHFIGYGNDEIEKRSTIDFSLDI